MMIAVMQRKINPLTSKNNTRIVPSTDPRKAVAPDRTPRKSRLFRPGVPRSWRKAVPAPEPSVEPSEESFRGGRASLMHVIVTPQPSAPAVAIAVRNSPDTFLPYRFHPAAGNKLEAPLSASNSTCGVSPEITVDQKLERLMKQLGEAINDSISDSEQIAEVIARIKSDGYDIFVVLEATVGFNKRETDPLVSSDSRQGEPELQISPQDARFLKSLRISIEPKPGRNNKKAA